MLSANDLFSPLKRLREVTQAPLGVDSSIHPLGWQTAVATDDEGPYELTLVSELHQGEYGFLMSEVLIQDLADITVYYFNLFSQEIAISIVAVYAILFKLQYDIV